ncbi:hypothetical protein [Paenibacillus lactis]
MTIEGKQRTAMKLIVESESH